MVIAFDTPNLFPTIFFRFNELNSRLTTLRMQQNNEKQQKLKTISRLGLGTQINCSFFVYCNSKTENFPCTKLVDTDTATL